MAYYQKILRPDEQLLYNEKLHWIIYIGRILLETILLIPILAWMISINFWERIFYSINAVLFILTIILLYILPLFSIWVRRATTEIIVTDKRIILKKGFLRRRTIEMNMNKVETVDVNQSILGRLLNYGTVLVRGSGSTYEPLKNVTDPIRLRNSILVR